MSCCLGILKFSGELNWQLVLVEPRSMNDVRLSGHKSQSDSQAKQRRMRAITVKERQEKAG